MIKHLLPIGLICCLLLSCETKQASLQNETIVDDLGVSFSFEKIPKRIITLAPNLTEIIFDLGLEKILVGNTMFCNYPDEAKKIEKVGDMLSFNYEKILRLNPDLVFITVEGNTKAAYEKFKALGIKTFVSNPRNFIGIKKTYGDLGKIFHVESLVESKIKNWDSTAAYIKENSKSVSSKTAMIIIELKPVMIAGKNTFLNEFIENCGLTNIADDSKVNYPIFSREEILKRNPDYIIYPAGDEDNISKIKNAYPEWLQLKAVKNKNVLMVDRDVYLRPGARFIDALKDLFTRLHPELKGNLLLL
jgi:iron complex transport system substrate-binding protein